MLRDFLQMIGNAFPVNAVIDRNTHGSVSSKCALCGAESETYTHPELDGIRQVAHDDIVDALTAELGERCECGRITVHTRPRAYSMGPCDDEWLASYEPDAII
eukprot:3840459-Rhodomonas_salina.1